MKWLIVLLVLLILVIGCEGEKDIPDDEKEDDEKIVDKEAECITNADCVTGGCSGTVCQAKSAKPIFTTCEYKEEYKCYKMINCGCVDGKCEWIETAEFDNCLEESKGGMVVV